MSFINTNETPCWDNLYFTLSRWNTDWSQMPSLTKTTLTMAGGPSVFLIMASGQIETAEVNRIINGFCEFRGNSNTSLCIFSDSGAFRSIVFFDIVPSLSNGKFQPVVSLLIIAHSDFAVPRIRWYLLQIHFCVWTGLGDYICEYVGRRVYFLILPNYNLCPSL